MAKCDKNTLIMSLEKALQSARNDAAGYADMGQTEDSIHAAGVADGLQQALKIVRNAPDGRGIFF